MLYLLADPSEIVTEDGLRLLRGSHLPREASPELPGQLASARRLSGQDVRLYRVERDGGWWRVVAEVHAASLTVEEVALACAQYVVARDRLELDCAGRFTLSVGVGVACVRSAAALLDILP